MDIERERVRDKEEEDSQRESPRRKSVRPAQRAYMSACAASGSCQPWSSPTLNSSPHVNPAPTDNANQRTTRRFPLSIPPPLLVSQPVYLAIILMPMRWALKGRGRRRLRRLLSLPLSLHDYYHDASVKKTVPWETCSSGVEFKEQPRKRKRWRFKFRKTRSPEVDKNAALEFDLLFIKIQLTNH